MTRARSSSVATAVRFGKDARGVTAVEFGLLAPVLMLLLLGAFDVGHGLFMKAVLEGEVQKASRNSGLETGGVAATQSAIDSNVRDQVRALASDATVTFNRRFYKSFSKAAAAQAEPYTDTNGNGRCDGEPYTDQNNNGYLDLDGGDSGQGGAKDTVLYTVNVSYPRRFPLAAMMGLSPTTSFQASTVMNNQPYGEQSATGTPTIRTCPS